MCVIYFSKKETFVHLRFYYQWGSGLDGVSFCGDGAGGDVKLDVICIADGVDVRQCEEGRRPSVTLRRAVSALCWKRKQD